nr:hypothetical protein [Clostridium neonatale]
MAFKYTDDDYCDIYENKICDNCGKCLEMDGVDVRAIKIEDIAKTQEENEILEEEFLEEIKSTLSQEDLEEIKAQNLNLMDIYKKFKEEVNFSEDDYINGESTEYEDAFDHIEYLDNVSLNEGDIDELTEEIYPGVRKLKKKINE